MTDNQTQRDKLVQEGVSKHNFEEAEAEVAVEAFFDDARSGESFEKFLLRDGWVETTDSTVPLGSKLGDGVDGRTSPAINNDLSEVKNITLEYGSSEDDDDANDVYSSIEGEIRGLNKHGFPAVTAKVGKESTICCKKDLHEKDRKVIQKHSAEELITAAETVAHEIDTADFIDTKPVAGAFLKDVLHQAEKDFGILRRKFKKHHAAKVVAEFLRFAEDKQNGEAMISDSQHYLGCLKRGRTSSSMDSFDEDDDMFPMSNRFRNVSPVGIKIFKKKKKQPAKKDDIQIVKDTDEETFGAGEKKELPINKRRTPIKDPLDGVVYGPIKYVKSYQTLAEHHKDSQLDEIWISARNTAQWTEYAAGHKVGNQPKEALGIFLMQAAYYCSSAVEAIPEIMSNESIIRGQANSHIKTMVYRSLIRRQLYPGKLSHLNPSQGPNKYNAGFGIFDTKGFDKFDETAFDKAAFKHSTFHIFGSPRRGAVKTLRQAELDLSGILQNSRIMTGKIDGASTKSIRTMAREHMSNVIPLLLKTKNKTEREKKIGALMELFSWNFVRLYQSARLYPNSEAHGDWLLEKTVSLMPGFYYTALDLDGIITKFDTALEETSEQQQQQQQQPNPGAHRVFKKTTQRIGAVMTLDKTRAITTSSSAGTSLDLCKEMERSAVKHLISHANQIAAEARVVLLMPVKNSPAWKNLTQKALCSRRALDDVIPSLILHQTGKYEFKSLEGQVYSAISQNKKDLRHIETSQDIEFLTDVPVQQVEYQGGGPTFLIASVDLGSYSSLP